MRKWFTIGAAAAAVMFWLVAGIGLLQADKTEIMAQTNPPATTTAPAQSPPAAPAPPQRTETINYDSWTLTCQQPLDKSTKMKCVGSLKVLDQQPPHRLLMSWLVGRASNGALQSVIATPTGVQIQSGVALKLGAQPPRKLTFVSCGPDECAASIDMDAAMIQDAVASGNAVVTVRTIDGRDVTFNFPIKGFDKIIPSIEKIVPSIPQ
jgi:invasion protein IalB